MEPGQRLGGGTPHARRGQAPEALLRECYGEMRRIARSLMAGESHIPLQPTDLAHEAAIRLGGAANGKPSA